MLPLAIIGVGVMIMLWARWLAREMSRIRELAAERGREREWDRRAPKVPVRAFDFAGCALIALGVALLIMRSV